MRRVVPFLLVLTAGLGSGAGAAVGLELGDQARAKQAAAARAAAEARERAAVATFRTALTPLAGAVNDALHDATAAYEVDSSTRDDLLLHGGAQLALRAPKDELRTLPVPASLEVQATTLLDGYEDLGKAVDMLVRGAGATKGTRTSTLILDGFDALDAGKQRWEESLTSVYGNSTDGHAADHRLRSPATTYIVTSSRHCLKGSVATAGIKLNTRAQLLKDGNRFAAVVASTVAGLRATPYNRSQAPKAHAIHELLPKAGDLGTAVRDGVTAVRRYDVAAARSVEQRITRAIKASGQVAQLYEQIGVTWCQVFFGTETDRRKTVGA